MKRLTIGLLMTMVLASMAFAGGQGAEEAAAEEQADTATEAEAASDENAADKGGK